MELKKVTSKHILKSTLTPTLRRREMNMTDRLSMMDKSNSLSSLGRDSARHNNGSETHLVRFH